MSNYNAHLKPMWANEREMLRLAANQLRMWAEEMLNSQDKEVLAIGKDVDDIVNRMIHLHANSESHEKSPETIKSEKITTYRLGETPTMNECKNMTASNIRAVRTGEFRLPLKNEWFLVEDKAFKACFSFKEEKYPIVKLVRVITQTTETAVEL